MASQQPWLIGIDHAFISFTPGQVSALEAYDMAVGLRDDDAIRATKYHIEAWDKHFGRESSIELRRKRDEALRKWGAYLFDQGAGI